MPVQETISKKLTETFAPVSLRVLDESNQHAGHAGHTVAGNIPVEMPDLPKLPFQVLDGVKEFHLIPEVVETELMPGRWISWSSSAWCSN